MADLTFAPPGMLPEGRRDPIRVWGIDLGTTNSTISEIHWDPTAGAMPECRTLDLEQPTTGGPFTGPLVPSVLAVAPNGEVWVGEGAKRLRSDPRNANLVPFKTIFFETKNDMGLRKSYPLAQERFNHARKIAGHVLEFIVRQAEQVTGGRPDRVVVTVPASFRLNQRQDTVAAAEAAGLSLRDYDLLDEPVAALLDYLMRTRGDVFRAGARTTVLIFDFGGGTCDVAIVEVEADAEARRLTASPKAVSRYHRLGGGDLDAAIVHEVLLPRLLEENGLDPLDLSWAEKKRVLEPQLLGTAEALKLALCKETDRLQKFGRYEAKRESLVVKQPAITCRVGDRDLILSRPELSAVEWERLLGPFLDTESLYQRDTEYRLIQSVFAPLDDALTRAGYGADGIDMVLLVGGSTLIPQIREAIRRYFLRARVCTFEDDQAAQLAVSRGAAWHAFFLEAGGRPFLQPVVPDVLALRAEGGALVPLVPAGSPIPYPAEGGMARRDDLAMPATAAREIRIEVVTLPDERPVLHDTWRIPVVVSAGARIAVEYALSANQVFTLKAYLVEHPEASFSREVENPLVSTVGSDKIRLEIEELEESLRRIGGRGPDDLERFVELARLYAELRQYERALQHIASALRLAGRPDPGLLTLRAIYYGDLGDFTREEKAYLEADRATGTWGGPMFNLALAYRRRNEHERALDAVRRSLAKEAIGPAYTLEAQCLLALGREAEAQASLDAARSAHAPPSIASDWELGWMEAYARMINDRSLLESVTEERSKRRGKLKETEEDDALRPVLVGAITRKGS
jgi:molecular chaperone DnaK (HSP70)